MTKGELGGHLNDILEAVRAIHQGCGQVRRVPDRLDAIRDAVVLIALDVKLPLQPVAEDDLPIPEPTK